MNKNKKRIAVATVVATSMLLVSPFLAQSGVQAETDKIGINEATYTSNTTRTEQEKVYGIGSVSKMFTTVAVLKLVDEGKIDLNTPVTEYIKEFTMEDERYQQITPLMLLNHSSGLMGTIFHNAFDYGVDDTDYHDTFLETLSHQSLKADPGEFSVYCNDGFTLAEILVERVSGMSFSEFIRQEISEPLGLTNTFTPVEEFDESRLATITMGGHLMPYVNCHCIGSGGIYSTTEDMAKFGQIFTKNGTKILSKESIALMQECWYQQDAFGVCEGDNQQAYGLGWDCVNTYPYSYYGIQALSKGGDVDGYHANLTVLPEQNISVSVNTAGEQDVVAGEMAQDIILQVLLEEGIIDNIEDLSVKTETNVIAEPLPEEYRAYAGYYLSNVMMQAEFTEDGMLLLRAADSKYDMTGEFTYIGNGEFVSTNGVYLNTTNGFGINTNEKSGKTIVSFCTESNGKTYMKGSMYETKQGIGETAFQMLIGEKVEAQQLSEQVQEKWNQRIDKKYYLIQEGYNSSQYLFTPCVKAEPIEEFNSYIKSNVGNKPCRIVDESTAICEMSIPGMVGRDLCKYSFYEENNLEYLKVNELTYMDEDGMESSSQLGDKVVFTQDEMAVWYRVEDSDASKLLTITINGDGAYYVYDKDDSIISSSICVGETNSVLLPKGGHLVLAGNEGTTFMME